MMNRNSGILLHITSLPSPYGVGNLGKAAFDFVDFLKKAGQSYWQILLICPPGYGDSPYQAFSTFAGNPYLIDPDQLVAAGWLTQEELDGQSWGENPAHVDYALLYETRLPMLRRAFARFLRSTPADFDEYVQQESAWLPEYSLPVLPSCVYRALLRHIPSYLSELNSISFLPYRKLPQS